MATPLPQDLFSRFAVEMFDEHDLIGIPTAGLTFFNNPARTFFQPDSNTVDIDIIRGNERTAKLVPRGTFSQSLGSLQKHVRDQQYTAFSRKYPLAREVLDVTSENLTTRIPGEPTVNSGLTQMFRFRYHALRKHTENMRRMTRLCEILAWQSLMTGKQDGILGTSDANLQFDFERNSDLTIQCGTSWAGGTANILADLDNGCTKLRQIGRMQPDIAVFGSGAINSFIRDATAQKLADNRRLTYMTFGDGAVMPGKFQKWVDAGFVFQGNLRTPLGYALAVFTYPEFYTADNGTATPYIAADKVLLTSSTARRDRYFGPQESLPMTPWKAQQYIQLFGIDPHSPPMPPNIKGDTSCMPVGSCFCLANISADYQRVSIETQCAPIFAPVQTDAYAVLDTEP
jgi:hypothetical protein